MSSDKLLKKMRAIFKMVNDMQCSVVEVCERGPSDA